MEKRFRNSYSGERYSNEEVELNEEYLELLRKILKKQKSMPREISKLVDDNFWKLF